MEIRNHHLINTKTTTEHMQSMMESNKSNKVLRRKLLNYPRQCLHIIRPSNTHPEQLLNSTQKRR